MNIRIFLFFAIVICASKLSYAQNFNQSIDEYAEGKYYKNNQTGLRVKYGYISSLNTYGLTFKNSFGNEFFFINCSQRFSGDKQYMQLTNCMSPDDGSGIGQVGVYKDKIIISTNEGSLIYYIENNISGSSNSESSPNGNSNNNSKSEKELLQDFYKINNLEIAKFNYTMTGYTLKDIKSELLKLGNGWRLPTRDELKLMVENKDELNLKGTTDVFLYVGEEDNKLLISFLMNIEPMVTEEPLHSNYKVRVVRSAKKVNIIKQPVIKKTINKVNQKK
jgi:hypothetical protein